MAAALLSGVLCQAAQPEQGGRWPFTPVGRVVPPAVTRTNWVSNPVDAFILSKLEANGIAPARLAKRRTLVRRLYFDLLGLPPESDGLPQESDDLPQEPEGQSRELLIAELPGWLALRLEAIGQRSRDKRRVRELLRALCAERPYRAAELSRLLKRNQEYLQKEYITPMRQAGELAYQYQDDPNRPDQAYVSPTANREAE